MLTRNANYMNRVRTDIMFELFSLAVILRLNSHLFSVRKSPVSKDKLGTSFKILSKIYYKKSRWWHTKHFFICIFYYKDGGLGHNTFNPPLGVEVQPPNASESQVNTTCARHTKRNYKTRHIRHETQDMSHKTWETYHKKIYIRHIRHKT